jgi:HSF-type DNA-binding
MFAVMRFLHLPQFSAFFNSWFNHSNYNSFQRQLNIYGFRRFREGRDKDAYYHQNFVRGEYQQTFNMERNSIKGTGAQRPSVVTAHPDFYQRHVRVDDPYVTSTTRTASISRSQPEPVSATRPESATASPNLYDTHIQSYLRANRRTVGAANSATSTAMQPNPYSYNRTSLFPNNDLLGIPRWSATTLNASSILARTELSPLVRREMLLSQALRGSVVEEMIQAPALVRAFQRQHRRDEYPAALSFARESRNIPYGNDPPASFRPEDYLDLLVRQSLSPPQGAGLFGRTRR